MDSAKVRHLQSILMVAAFKCNQFNYDARGMYNQFVRVHRMMISGHNDNLKRYFLRAHGLVDGQREYDRFTTALANSDSETAQRALADYCEAAFTLGRAALASESQELALLAAEVRGDPFGVGSRCDATAPVLAAAARVDADANVAVAAAALAAEAAAEPEPEPAVEPVIAPAVLKLDEPAAAPIAAAKTGFVRAETKPIEVAASDQIDAAPAKQAETARALAVAAEALKAAADALKAASAPIPDAEPVARASVPSSRLR
ncbi:MAG: hypothetical protein RQ833_06035 [Sphingomonadaceae bacterium]|nr:hypothetical protein [Sphingomonadaceae bacterium]